jgi:hypothetical protein
MNWDNSPRQPSESDWHFIEELKSPLWERFNWQSRTLKCDEVFLGDGISLKKNFKDLGRILETAYDDLHDFFESAGVKQDGKFNIITEYAETEVPESWQIEVSLNECRISAGDSEGIRRAIFFIEDEMLAREGLFLPLGKIRKRPFIRTRISRCFFGPIKRPPMNRDELEDDVNYYPDGYLNRLAHDGVNGLWLTVSFRDLCPSRFFPEHGKDGRRRIEKLIRTVNQCARYGIKIYLFCIEPIAFG